MSTVEKLSEKELKDRTIITESLIYGHQRKHYPKRNENTQIKLAQENKIKEEIAKTKRDIITDEDYDKLI